MVTFGKQGARRAMARSLRYRICGQEQSEVSSQSGPPQVGSHAGWNREDGVFCHEGVGSSGSPEPEWEGREGQPGAREGQQREAEDLSASSQASSRG